MTIARLARVLLLLALLLSGAASPLSAARAVGAAPAEGCFPETGFCVQGRFLAYWQQHGGLAINGYPLTAERQERLEDGKTYTVQYFERVRMEYHPENPPPHDVQLGQLGRRIHPADPPVAPDRNFYATVRYFPETGHNLYERINGGGSRPDIYDVGFLAYWEANGGLDRFGYPISELRREQLEDGRVYGVQYFERALRENRGPDHARPARAARPRRG